MKKATNKKVPQPKKPTYCVTRRVITETVFKVPAVDESEAVRLVVGCFGKEVSRTTRTELTVGER